MLYQGQLQEYFGNLLNSFTNLIKSAGAGAKVRSPKHTKLLVYEALSYL